MRESYFPSYHELEAAARNTRQSSNLPALVPFPSPGIENTPGLAGNVNEFSESPAISRVAEGTDIATPRSADARQIPRSDAQIGNSRTPSQEAAERIAALEAEQRREQQREQQPVRRLVSTSPRLELEIKQPSSVIINQEITHQIRITNAGDAPAPGVVVSTEIPAWIDVQHLDASNGNVMLRTREDGSGITDLEWKIDRLDQSATELLILRSVSQQRRAIELSFRHDYYRPAIVAKVEVQEPRLEMELLGSDEVRWNEIGVYTLLVRNVGNGDAENIRLELLQTSSEAKDCTFQDPLRPGEVQEMSIQVKSGGEQEFIDIAVLATGSHEVRAEIKRRLRVLRPKLVIDVQTLPLHFVDNSAEVTIRVRNIGTADVDNVAIRAELPLGARYTGSSEGGISTIQQQQNIVEWRGKSIARNEMQMFTLFCVPQREGECRVSVEAVESGGTLLAASHGTFMAEAVVELDLAVVQPRGPIELGQEVEYEIQVTNVGTKAAENVAISMTFGPQLEPTGVSGGEASATEDGQVFFEKIPVIIPKGNVTVKVAVKAEKTGMAPIRAEVARSDASGTPIRLERGLNAYIVSRRGTTATASGQTQDEVVR
jgi:hypothetical protein